MAESARTTIALIFNMRGGRFGGLPFSHATAAALPSAFAASADIDVSGAPFSTLSINTLRCRPFSRGSSTSSPSSAPSIALPSGELADRRPFSRSLLLSDKRAEIRFWSSEKNQNNLVAEPDPRGSRPAFQLAAVSRPIACEPLDLAPCGTDRLVRNSQRTHDAPAGGRGKCSSFIYEKVHAILPVEV
jgi:hypothetical protein